MDRKTLLRACREMGDKGVWCIPESTLWAAAGYPDKAYLRVALARHVKAGLITRFASGLYANPFCPPPAQALFRLANFLRPQDDFYLSTESVLSECGWISQLPFCLTFVTTGRSYRFSTSLGDIYFTHTEEDPLRWPGQMQYDTLRQVWVATPDKALADLKRYRRNLDLVLPKHDRPD